MERKEIKQRSKEQIKGNIFKLFVITVIIAIINSVCLDIEEVGPFISTILNAILQMGVVIVYLKLVKGEGVSITDMFKGFNMPIKAILVNILVTVFAALWSLLFVIPGIIKSLSYFAAPYILAENPEMSVLDAITKSRQMMDGHKADLFILQLSFFFWWMLVPFTFGLALIYVIPYMSAAMTNFYLSLKETDTVEAEVVSETTVE